MAWLDLLDMLGPASGPKSSAQVTWLSTIGTPGLPFPTSFDPKGVVLIAQTRSAYRFVFSRVFGRMN